MTRRIAFLVSATVMAAILGTVGCSKSPEPPATVPAVSQPAAHIGNVSDIDVTEHVKTALLQSESLKGFDIEVVTLKGDVRLIGRLDNQAQIDEAIQVARASAGSHTIHDELTVRP
jgi:osmotically-inducible protein OsmY